MLDADMLSQQGVSILPAGTPDQSLPTNPGSIVASQLGKRYLLRYLMPSQLNLFALGNQSLLESFCRRPHYVTPTPFSPEETVSWLALPAPDQLRPYVLLLKPEKIDIIAGPRWVRMGGGIEYFLPKGFGLDAIVDIGVAPNTKWPLLVS